MKSKLIHPAKVLLFYSCFYCSFFSPVLFRSQLLAPGDALLLYLPSFLSPVTLWEPNLQGGFPVAADLQTATWYPLARFFALFSGWNGFVISAFVLTSCFCYAYVYFLTRSWIGALIAGVVAGSSGFMISHLGHTIVIHGFVWIPLLLLSIEKIANSSHRIWFVIGSVSIAMMLLAGHPQIPAYGIVVSGLYVLMRTFFLQTDRLRFLLKCFGIYLTGLALTGIQLVPLFELVSYSVRDESTLKFFTTYSLPPLQLVSLLYPMVFGVHKPDASFVPYFGAWNFTEMTGYVGVLPLMLACIGFKQIKPRYFGFFWGGIALLGLMLALGDATPLANVMFQIPLLNRFRVPARHLSEMTLAISFLAGFGAALIHKREISKKVIIYAALIIAFIFIIASAALFIHSKMIQQMAVSRGFMAYSLEPWKNLSVAIPIIVTVCSMIILILNFLRPGSIALSALVIVISLDLCYFGFCCEWRNSQKKEVLNFPRELQAVHATLKSTNQRLMPVLGVRSSYKEGTPNLSRLWDLPSASGYGSLVMRQINELFSMPPDGALYGSWASKANRSLDLMAVRYVSWSTKTRLASERQVESRIPWSTDNLHLQIGANCGEAETLERRINLPIDFQTSSIGIVSALSCSLKVPQGSPVVRVTLVGDDGIEELQLRAGLETAEWSYDCHREGKVQHLRPQVLKMKIPMRNEVLNCDGRMFVSLKVLKKPLQVRQIKFNWTGAQGLATIYKLTLISDSGNKFPVTGNAISLSQHLRWTKVDGPSSTLFENQRAMPRAWLVHRVSNLSRKNILRTINTSNFPDGTPFRPKDIGLVEEKLQISGVPHRNDSAKIVQIKSCRVEINVETKTPAFLILSDVFYPGWKAVVNGTPAHIYRTNYAFRGIQVPAGTSNVILKYEPLSFYIGLCVTSAATVFLLAIYFVPSLKRSKRSPTELLNVT